MKRRGKFITNTNYNVKRNSRRHSNDIFYDLNSKIKDTLEFDETYIKISEILKFLKLNINRRHSESSFE